MAGPIKMTLAMPIARLGKDRHDETMTMTRVDKTREGKTIQDNDKTRQ